MIAFIATSYACDVPHSTVVSVTLSDGVANNDAASSTDVLREVQSVLTEQGFGPAPGDDDGLLWALQDVPIVFVTIRPEAGILSVQLDQVNGSRNPSNRYRETLDALRQRLSNKFGEGAMTVR